MIKFRNVGKSVVSDSGRKIVLNNVSFSVSCGKNIGILMPWQSGKTTLAKIICGALPIDNGTVERRGLVCPTVGNMPEIDPKLNAVENTRYLARLYRQDPDHIESLCRYLTHDAVAFNKPLEACLPQFRARLSLSVTCAIPFDVYVIDNTLPRSGDADFMQRALPVFAHRFTQATVIALSSDPDVLRRFCNRYAVLRSGVFTEVRSLPQSYKDFANAA